MDYQCLGKKSWPELVGARGVEAAEKIERENHRVKAVIVNQRIYVTQEYRCNRVRVWVNDDGVVVRPPHIG